MPAEPQGRLRYWLQEPFQLYEVSVLPWSGPARHSRPAFLNAYERVPRDWFWHRPQCYRREVEPRYLCAGDHYV